MSGTSWAHDAPCQGDLRFTPAEGAVATLDAPLTWKLLKICQDCPYRAACIARVLPKKSAFDGICGGRLWINGRVRAKCAAAQPEELDEQGSYIPHGTPAGARAHNRRGEPACEFCRWAGRVNQADRRLRGKAARRKESFPQQKVDDIDERR